MSRKAEMVHLATSEADAKAEAEAKLAADEKVAADARVAAEAEAKQGAELLKKLNEELEKETANIEELKRVKGCE